MAKQEEQQQSSTALARLTSAYPALAGGGAVAEAMLANLEGEEVTMFDLERIKVPTGGGIAWEIPPPDGEGEPDVARAVEGIIVYTKMGRAFWPGAFGGEVAQPPQCSSPDGVHGIGDPGGECARCQFAEFGSRGVVRGDDSRSQACKQMRFVFLLREGRTLPSVIALPPTSIGPMRKFLLGISQRSRPYWSVITRFQLVKAKNAGGIEYAQVRPSVVRELAAEEVETVVKFAKLQRETYSKYREGMGGQPSAAAYGDEEAGVEVTA